MLNSKLLIFQRLSQVLQGAGQPMGATLLLLLALWPTAGLTQEAVAAEAQPAPPIETPAPTPTPIPTLKLLGAEIAPGQSRRLSWQARYGFGELDASTPVQVVHGRKPGLVMCLTAAVHGDELNGIEIVRRVMQGLDPEALTGSVIGVPIVNLPGFQRGSRYLPDRRDLNRYFPGDPRGSLAARIARDFFDHIIRHCDHLVDLHTGSFARTNLPQLRADLRNPRIVEMTRGFGDIAVLHSQGGRGTLRRAANEAGIVSVTMEVGEPDRLQPDEVARGVKGIESLMGRLGMTPKKFVWREPQPVFYESRWVRVDRGGILFTNAELGDRVKVGDRLGTVTDPLSNVRTDVLAPHNGRVLGRALNQFVMPGFAAFRLGIQTTEEAVVEQEGPAPTEAGAEPAAATGGAARDLPIEDEDQEREPN